MGDDSRRHHGVGRGAVALQVGIHKAVLVDGQRDGLTHADVIQRRHAGVQVQPDDALELDLHELVGKFLAGVASDIDGIDGNHIQRAGLILHQRGALVHVVVVDFIQRRTTLVIVLVGDNVDEILGGELLELEGAGADEGVDAPVFAGLLAGGLRIDDHLRAGQDVHERRIGVFQLDGEVVIVDDLHAFQFVRLAVEHRVAALDHVAQPGVDVCGLGIKDAAEREVHVVGGQLRAVVEVHVVAELAGVDEAVLGDGRQLREQLRIDGAVRAQGQERLADQDGGIEHLAVGGLVDVQQIHAFQNAAKIECAVGQRGCRGQHEHESKQYSQ